MFVERLSKEEFAEFIAKERFVQAECGMISKNVVDAIREFEVQNGRVSLSIGRVDFVFTDFDCVNNYMFRSYNGAHNKEWLAFMFGKFGEDYKLAFYKYRTQEKRRMLNRVGEQFNKETKNYEKLFQAEDEFES